MKNCFCCSQKKFSDCCEPILTGTAKPETAEALMRSRYSAYATANVDYIICTTHRSTVEFHDPASIENWAKSSLWQKLEIVFAENGNREDSQGTVEFKAHYLDFRLQSHVHHERSNFLKEAEYWFFVDGEIVGK
jgi:SEC-C motif domain protein